MNNRKICDFTDYVGYISTLSPNIDKIKDDLISYYICLKENNDKELSPHILQILQNELGWSAKHIAPIIDLIKSEKDEYTQQDDVMFNIYDNAYYDLMKNLRVKADRNAYNLLYLLPYVRSCKLKSNNIYADLLWLQRNNIVTYSDLYLTLLSQNNIQNLGHFLEYDLNYCDLPSNKYYKHLNNMFMNNEHWLLDIINSFKKNDFSSSEIAETLNGKLFQLIMLTITDEEISVNYFHPIERVTRQMEKSSVKNQIILKYCQELCRKIAIARFCYENSLADNHDLFKTMEAKSLLCILNNTCILSDFQHERIIDLLKTDRKALAKILNFSEEIEKYSWQEDLYNSYFIIIGCIRTMILTKQSENVMQDILASSKHLFESLKSLELRLDVLQYMFCILFLRHEQISWENFLEKIDIELQINSEEEGFMCTSQFLHDYLKLLKMCANSTQLMQENEMKENSSCSFDDKYSSKLSRLTRRIERLEWRMQLLSQEISNLSQDNSEQDSSLINSMQDIESTAIFTNARTTLNRAPKQKDCISLLLSPPESLVTQCMTRNDFKSAHEVIQEYQIETSLQAEELKFIENYIKLKSELTNDDIQDPQTSSALSFSTRKPLVTLIEDFMKNYSMPRIQDDEDILEINQSKYPYLTFYNKDSERDMILADIISGVCVDNQSSREIIGYIKDFLVNSETNPYKTYLKNIIDIFQIGEANTKGSISITDVIVNDIYPRDIESYKKLIDFNMMLTNNLPNLERPGVLTEASYVTIMNALENNPYDLTTGNSDKFNFMKYLLEYLRKLKQLAMLDLNYDKDLNMFEMLNVPLKHIVGDLIHVKGILANDVEKITNEMGVNLVEVITAGLCEDVCPIVDLHRNEFTFETIEFDDKFYKSQVDIPKYRPDIVVMTYLKKHNWLVAYLIEKLYDIDSSDRYMHVELLKKTFAFPRIQNLKKLYDNNATKAALGYLVDIKLLNRYLDENELTKMEELNILQALPEIQYKHSLYLRSKRNTLLRDLSVEDWKYMQNIDDIELQYESIVQNMKTWDEKSLQSALRCVIENNSFGKLADHNREFLMQSLHKVSMYTQVAPYLPSSYTWREFQTLSETNAGFIFETLLENKQVELCLNWIHLFPESREHLSDMDEDLLCDGLEVTSTNMLVVSKFLHELDINQALKICEKSLRNVGAINAFKVFGRFMQHHDSDVTDSDLLISIDILMDMSAAECLGLFKIITQPLLIVEQYLMNCKFDKLAKIIDKIKKKLDEEHDYDSSVTLVQLEKVLLTYAKKSLRFDVSNTPRSSGLSSANEELMQPIDAPVDEEFTMPPVAPKKSEWIANESASECMCCHQVTFTMFNRRHHCRRCGRVVCGLCSMNRLKLTAYNDLNVRACNQCYDQTKAAEGPSSDSQTSDDNSLNSSKKDFALSLSEQASEESEWVLTGNLDHDNAIREEFSFIHAPSVSLCLAILTLHNDSEEAPNFLLSECDAVIRLMKPKIIGRPNNEIDYPLLIEMMRSMAIAAKVKYSHLAQLKTNKQQELITNQAAEESDNTAENRSNSYLYAGISRCEDILNYADLASLLVQHGCEGLLTQSLTGYDIQMLREQLVRSERWTVALDVSLKAGLDRSSVFAAWGKACLRAGAFRTAREKFGYCLRAVQDPSGPRTPQEDIFTVTNFGEEKYSSSVFKYSSDQQQNKSLASSSSSSNLSTVKTRPQKDPILLNEIIDILEKATYSVNSGILKNLHEIKQSQESSVAMKLGGHMRNNMPEPALYILHTLSNLKNITNGIYEPINEIDKTKTQKTKRSRSLKTENFGKDEYAMRPLEKFIFDECKYYLTTYGSHIGIIRFYMKHSTLTEVLEYVLNNNVDKSVFTEVVYMECLKKGTIGALHRHLTFVDPTLLVWKDHLSNTCRHLEKLKYMNTLYDLQLVMKDHIRASMTCIYFYSHDCTTYTNLHQKVEYLNTAEKFLRQELELVITATSSTFHVLKEASVGASGFIKKMSYRELDRHINTICKQREVAKFLAACEVHGRDTFDSLNKIFAAHNESSDDKNTMLPTLFGSQLDRLQVATLVILCGQNVEEGFGLAFRIAQDYQLQGSQLYRECARYLARCGGRLTQVAQLCRCVRTSGLNEQRASALVDELAAAALYEASALEGPNALEGADTIIHAVSDIGVMISCYINIRQLKSAYLLAVKHDRLVDVRRIQREAERLGQSHVVTLCTKRLNM